MKTSVIVRSNLIHIIGLYLMNLFYIIFTHISQEKSLSQFFDEPFRNLIMAFFVLTIFEAVYILLFFTSIVSFDIIFFKKYTGNIRMYFVIEAISVLIFVSIIVLSFNPNLLLATGIFSIFFFFSQYLRYLWIKKKMNKLNKN
jgi:hypothetical protein